MMVPLFNNSISYRNYNVRFWQLVLICVLFFLSSNAPAAECENYLNYPHLVSMARLPFNARSITISGSLAIMKVLPSSISLVDISNPADPEILGKCDGVLPRGRMVVQGGLVYFADAKKGLCVLDISDTKQPKLVASYNISKGAHNISVANGLACVVLPSGMQFWDVSDPLAAQWISSYWEVDQPVDAQISGEHLFVLEEQHGLKILDISSPEQAHLIGLLDGFINVSNLSLSGSMATFLSYSQSSSGMVANDCALVLVDLANPLDPQIAEILEIPRSKLVDLSLQGDTVYLLEGNGKILSVDVSDQLKLSLCSTFDAGQGRSLDAFNGGLLVFSGMELAMVSFPKGSSVSQPVWQWEETKKTFKIYDISVANGLGFFALGEDGLQVLDFTNPQDPVYRCGVSGFGFAKRIVAAGKWAFVAGKGGLVALFDISDSNNLVQTYHGLAGARVVAIEGNTAFSKGGFIGIFKISKAGFPTHVGEYRADSSFDCVSAKNSFFYTVASDHVFHIGSYDDPTNPRKVGSVAGIPGQGAIIELGDDFAYVLTKYPSMLQVVDISDPTAPILRGQMLLPQFYENAVIEGNYMYLSSSARSINLVDLSDPDQPKFAGAINDVGNAKMAILGGYLCCFDPYSSNLKFYRLQCE